MLLNCDVGEDLRVPWTARRSNQSILKEINPECSLVGLMLSYSRLSVYQIISGYYNCTFESNDELFSVPNSLSKCATLWELVQGSY